MSMNQNRPRPKDLPWKTLEALFGGDRSKFPEFFRHYNPIVRWAVGQRVYRWPELTPHFEDIVQDVWFELTRRDFKRLRYYKGDRDVPFHRYLGLIAARHGWRIAKRHLDPSDPILEDIPKVDDGFELEMLRADLLERLAGLIGKRLSATDHRIFVGYYVRGERLKTIAAELAMTEEAIYQRHRRMLSKIGKIAAELDDRPKSRPEVLAMTLAAFAVLAPGALESTDNPTDVEVADD